MNWYKRAKFAQFPGSMDYLDIGHNHFTKKMLNDNFISLTEIPRYIQKVLISSILIIMYFHKKYYKDV